jgi:hypothetical protein
MAEIVNLRRARKERERAREQAKAAGNRVLFGRAKAERLLTEAEREKARRDLDARRLDPPDGD